MRDAFANNVRNTEVRQPSPIGLWRIFALIFPLLTATVLFASSASASTVTETPAGPFFNVSAFVVESKWVLSSNILISAFSKFTGTNVSLNEIVQAAGALEGEYVKAGQPHMNIVVSPKEIQGGIVTFNAFPGAVAQVIVAGYRYLYSTNGALTALNPHPPKLVPETTVKAAPANTNAGPRFAVGSYQVFGNSLLPVRVMSAVLTNIAGAFGTNVSLDKILEVRSRIQAAYYERGYVAVAVELPPQKLTNATVKLNVVEGRLHAITVKGNRYFSTANVMRALPGLHTNMMLNGITFQAELNRANANQDRQIYTEISPGPDPGTSDLTLVVKDRIPVHGKLELDNENSPGTPELRVASSAVYDNLWQHENALGLQYSFSPEQYKSGEQWGLYDLPSVANYSAFYRIPLGGPQAIDDMISAQPGSFGYNEATRKFNLPPASGQPDLTIFASRSTIDNGLTSTFQNLYTSTVTNSDGSLTTNSVLNKLNDHQDITINNDAGFRLNYPLVAVGNFHAALSGGADFKTYSDASSGTNIYQLSSEIIDTLSGNPQTNYNHSTDSAPIASTYNEVYYVPLTLRYDSGWRDALGLGTFGVGLTGDIWDSATTQTTTYGTFTNRVTHKITKTSVKTVSGESGLQAITGSKETDGKWFVLNPSVSHTLELVTNWVTTIRADGQWTTEPLISNEQFGAGGVNSVRGYNEGEVFGDTGWHVSLEQATPPHIVGMIRGRIPLVIQGTVYMDYAQVYLLDPRGRKQAIPLWGTGIGCVASIGSFWQTRFLFSVPLLDAGTITAYHPFFDFELTAQF
jgi:hemolysin activation/secretion protein